MSDPRVKRMTRRDMRREATKATVIEAAREVFLQRGYDGATIKLIADEASVSPGTVLNAAPSKAALLIQILQEEYETIRDTLDRLEQALSGDVPDRLVALLQAMLEAQSQHSELFSAAIGHSWLWSDPVYEETFEQMNLAWAPVVRILEQGKEAGELAADSDVDEVCAALQEVYLGAFRRIRREEIDMSGAGALLRRRVNVLLKGCLA
ncbi:TetR/AcrR family transcriptional regulator [Marinicauda pacifica]|uniref:TetR/AcrR family transcriptional regulator n=1 Tax=Marinicauda pacifica TaxID=1133559 RepID=UPI0035C86CE7